MSTIATPRSDLPRRIPSSSALHTPSSSTRPSLDIPIPSSTTSSPNLSTSSLNPSSSVPSTKRNRAALREYYNLRASKPLPLPLPSIITPSSPFDTQQPPPTTPASILDSPSFSPSSYLSQLLESSSLSDLLQTYTRILSEIRALDAEKKALVYDNYSKLITATETIRKMRTTMDPLNPMAGTLDLVVARVYDMARGLREEMRQHADDTDGEVYRGMERMRGFIQQGDQVQAATEWEMPRRLLVTWRERGVGGEEVTKLIEEGDGILAGSNSGENGGGDESG
ncbi:Vps51/Vps67-domain-containing protein [Apiosordaria backusii]|uniref:Vacuolar protein sorting-associated protein 51 homolog n=1 Tax=Apiosordaria backusii TaxID=314023 RepID=A0AA40AT07_9PEZI|nr:Vps51/Vps67-domain-containing protein [Apiosordaria backusii]